MDLRERLAKSKDSIVRDELKDRIASRLFHMVYDGLGEDEELHASEQERIRWVKRHCEDILEMFYRTTYIEMATLINDVQNIKKSIEEESKNV